MELDQQLAMAMHHESNNSNQNQEMDLPDGGGNWDQSSIDGKAGDHSNITGSQITGLFPKKGKRNPQKYHEQNQMYSQLYKDMMNGTKPGNKGRLV